VSNISNIPIFISNEDDIFLTNLERALMDRPDRSSLVCIRGRGVVATCLQGNILIVGTSKLLGEIVVEEEACLCCYCHHYHYDYLLWTRNVGVHCDENCVFAVF